MMTVSELIEDLRRVRGDLPVNLAAEGFDGRVVFAIASHIDVRRVERNSDHVKANDGYALFITSRDI